MFERRSTKESKVEPLPPVSVHFKDRQTLKHMLRNFGRGHQSGGCIVDRSIDEFSDHHGVLFVLLYRERNQI